MDPHSQNALPTKAQNGQSSGRQIKRTSAQARGGRYPIQSFIRPTLLMPRFSLAPFHALTAALFLSACGGGGADSSPGSSAPGSSGATTFSAAPTLSGVAAVGAPLVNAQIAVVDATGAAVGSTTTHAADGSYSLTLSSKTLTGPLLVQARGMDAAGNPQVIHSAVPALSAASAVMVANVTPLSDAVVALGLGADPAPVFAAAAGNAGALAKLAAAAGVAGDFVRSLVKTPISDLKLTKPELLADAGFAANKGAADLLLEGLRVNLGKSSSGAAQLQLANKLAPTATAEVVVDLAAAQTELLNTTTSTPANAISSSLKTSTSATATLANLGSLDELGAALNKLIAQGADATAMAASPLLAGYDVHNGRLKAEVAAKLAGFASKNRQLGRWQVTGCADEVAASGGACARLSVSAAVSDASGAVIEVYSDAVAFNKASTSGSKWNLIGNGKKLGFAVYPLAFLAMNADASLSSAISPNPGIGVQLEIQAQGAAGAKLLNTATVQAPGVNSIPFAYCGRPLLCISTTPGATVLVPTGGSGDTALQQAAVGWVGSADSLRGARYIGSWTLAGVAETRNAYLRADVLAEPARGRFPALDGVAAATPLRAADLIAGRSLSWTAWAAANPDMRLISVRSVLAFGAGIAPLVTDTAPPLPPRVAFDLAALNLATGAAPVGVELWLGAQDAAGRRYYSRYSITP